MAEPAAICAVCHRSRIRGDRNDLGDVFICAECQAVARQFIEMQDRIWGEAVQTAEATGNSNDGQHQRRSRG